MITANLASSPVSDRLDLRNPANQPKAHPPRPAHRTPQTHFLSIIAFDGNVTMNTFDAVMAAQHEKKLWNGWKVHAGEGQVRSRNECADQFLNHTPLSHHFFLDADIQPRAAHVQMLREHPEAADSIIVGLYCKKQDRIAHPYNSIKDGNPEPNARGLMEIAKGATGFMQIPRVAYQKIMDAHPDRFYFCDYDIKDGVRKKKFSFFFHDIRVDSELGMMRDQSEDWAFCELARQAGVKIYADVKTASWDPSKPGDHCILHRGQALFPLQTEMQRLDAVDQLTAANAKIAALEMELKAAKGNN